MKAYSKSFNFFFLFLIFNHGKVVKLDCNECVFFMVCISTIMPFRWCQGWTTRQTDRQTDSDRQLDRQKDRQTLICRLTRYLSRFEYKVFVLMYTLQSRVSDLFLHRNPGKTMQTLFVANHVRIRFQRPDCDQKHLLYHRKATISSP